MKLVTAQRNIARHHILESCLSFSMSFVSNKENNIFIMKRPKTGKIPP